VDYQAESATISQGVAESNHTGYTGTGFVNYDNVSGSYVQWPVTASAAGTATIVLRYANGTTTNRPMDIAVNGTVVSGALSFAGTGNWDTWQTKTITATVNAGTNTIRATSTTANGGPNVDKLSVSVDTGPPPGGPAVPFGSHLLPYVSGTLKPSGTQSTVDQAIVTYSGTGAPLVTASTGPRGRPTS
jgi:hypothetical protein